jgi:hypothetical protein
VVFRLKPECFRKQKGSENMISLSRIGMPLRPRAARREYQTSAEALALFRAKVPAAPATSGEAVGWDYWQRRGQQAGRLESGPAAGDRTPNEASCARHAEGGPVKSPANFFCKEQSYRSRSKQKGEMRQTGEQSYRFATMARMRTYASDVSRLWEAASQTRLSGLSGAKGSTSQVPFFRRPASIER